MRATRVPRTIQNTTAIVLPIGLVVFAWLWLTRPIKWPKRKV
jgi:HAMP domain-containing protein